MSVKELRDILPENNQDTPVIPQLLTNRAEDFLSAAGRLADYGYREINFNLGCPSGTVTAKKKGSGFLGEPEALDRFFDRVFSRIPGFCHERAIIVGDSLTSDIAGGINAGIDTCWYNPKNKPVPANMEITYIKNNLSEIEDVVLWGK